MTLLSNTIIAIVLCFTTVCFSQSSNAYKVIYAADEEGKAIFGDRETLVDYTNNGNPIRVGWDLRIQTKDSIYTMSHWADAGFITILEGHVFAQVRPIYAQGPKRPAENEIPAVFLTNAEPNSWIAIIGTTGVMRQKFKRDKKMIDMLKQTMTEKEIDEFLKDRELINVSTKWAVLEQ
ncbi:hypothetical protein [Winogradskyella flava]|uniref:Uncharacterized protein n=1 Tax=Winogradskyella flava TaxID=1884876 RepID=A0A842IQU7_9FLAO|nr:hypothetical protein [Winogradskyella flava]MBC2845095.1 hypothetical protein [Winogradskyella flava]